MAADNIKNATKCHVETVLTHAGRAPGKQYGFVNAPVVRGSTAVFPSLDSLEARDQPYFYGRLGNPTTDAAETLVTELEEAAGTVLAPSGLTAVAVALLSAVKTGDDVLITDSVYEPTRKFADQFLSGLGVTARYYDPRIGADIADMIGPGTTAIFMESPGSLTFEIQDLPAIAAARGQRDIKIIIDNSWATPLFYKPLTLGADLVVHAATKMFSGHSDVMSGTISATDESFEALQQTHRLMGICASPDDAYVVARGIRTLAVRMKEHEARALELAQWLQGRPGVADVLHPALPDHLDHALFKRDFTGSGSLFSVILEPRSRFALAAMLDNLELYAMGYSWGGYESLAIPADPARIRTAVPWTADGQLVRIHVGFESMDDLKADLAAGLDRYLAATT